MLSVFFLCVRVNVMLGAESPDQIERCDQVAGEGMMIDRVGGWVNRLLNSLPASRMSATALEAFLKTAGFRMNAAFGRQFHKLLAYIDSVFMPDLARQGDPDARAVHSRLRSYMHDQQYLKEPEGRRMPFSDISAREHA